MNVLHLCVCIALGRSTKGYSQWTIWKKNQSFGIICLVSSINTCWKWIQSIERLITYLYLFWHGRVWRHHLHQMGLEMTSFNICSLHLFLVQSFDTKISHFKCQWKLLMMYQYYANLTFISINVSLRKTAQLKISLWIFLILIIRSCWGGGGGYTGFIIPPRTTKLLGGYTGFTPSVRPSVRPSRIPCPLCSAYSFGWIHFIFIHLVKQLQKVCRVWSFLQNFKIFNFGYFLNL